MAFEIDFIGVPKEFSKQDADAIAVRWKADNSYKVIVYDGGFKVHGEVLVNHMKKYYFNGQNGIIDAVVVSHPDQDHTSYAMRGKASRLAYNIIAEDLYNEDKKE